MLNTFFLLFIDGVSEVMNFKSVYMLFLLLLSAAFTSAQANEGEKLYQAKGCASCHGPAECLQRQFGRISRDSISLIF